MALNSKYNFISRIKLFMYNTKEHTMPTNTYSVEAEITRNIVAEVEATSQEEAEELVGNDPDAHKLIKDDWDVTIGSTTWTEVEAL